VVPAEPVTFRVATGLGTIGAPPAAPGPTFSTQTDGSGIATLPQWTLGAIVGPQQVTAEIENGAQMVTFHATAKAVAVDLPVVNAVWPPYASALSPVNNDTRMTLALFERLRCIELNFSHSMNPAHLSAPADWLRFFMIVGSPGEYFVRRIDLRYATAAEAAACAGTIPSVVVGGHREFFKLVIDDGGSVVAGSHAAGGTPAPAGGGGTLAHAARRNVAAAPGPLLTPVMMEAFTAARVGLSPAQRIVKCLILVKSDPAARIIEDQLTPPKLLDADFQGTTLETLPGAGPGRSLWDDIWDVPLGATPVFGTSLWNAIQVTADTLPSGDTIEGGRLASWFTREF
jgi:hypothetical protein